MELTRAVDHHTREQAPEHFELEATTRVIEVGVRMSHVLSRSHICMDTDCTFTCITNM